MRSLIKFFLLTFVVSWAFWIAAATISGGNFSASPTAPSTGLRVISSGLVLLGVFAPALIALALTATADGRAGVAALFYQILQWRVSARWYVFAVGYFAAIKLSVALVYRIATGTWPAFGQIPLYIMLAVIVFSTPVQAGEEIGWRGYALPRLARHCGLGYGSIILGVIWSCWHLPFFFIAGSDNSGQSFPVYLLAVTALSVALAWVYWRTKGSLLLTMLMHAAINNTAGIVTSPASTTNPFALRTSLVAWLTAGLLWICAGYLLMLMRGSEIQGDSSYHKKARAPMLKTLLMIPFLFTSVALAGDNPIDRWANAVGGRDKLATIKSIYREGTIEFGGQQIILKVWHTADGKYRKEEKGGSYSLIETFDGVNGMVKQGGEPPHKMTGAELELATSRRFANANAMFFAFFPERRHGTVSIEADNTIVLKPEGGIEWRVMLDPQTSLPKTMVHKEGDRTITVTFDSFETVHGIKFEKEIRRSAGGPQSASIQFTKTVINPPVDSSLFSIPD